MLVYEQLRESLLLGRKEELNGRNPCLKNEFVWLEFRARLREINSFRTGNHAKHENAVQKSIKANKEVRSKKEEVSILETEDTERNTELQSIPSKYIS